jgi:hypothetical protein
MARSLPPLAAILLLVPIAAHARPTPADDTQWWQELDLTGSLARQFTYLVAGFTRFSDNDPNPALSGAGGFLTFTQGSLAYTLGYLHAQVRIPGNGDRLNADLPIAAATGTIKSGFVTLSNRLRVEDLIGVPGHPWRYRNLLSVNAAPSGWGPIQALVVSDEIFIDLNPSGLARNRLILGPVFGVSKRFTLSLDYVNERDIGARPGRIRGASIDASVHL